MYDKSFEIKALTPDLLQDFLSFFESIEFKDHPDWAVCYCHSFHFTGTSAQWNRDNNRSAVIRMISNKTMLGYLAYHLESPVGWCNVNNRLNYQRMIQYEDLMEPSQDRIASIVCYLVHPEYRRQGIAAQFLSKIEQDYRRMDYDWLEAYPGKGALSPEGHYMGPPELYLTRGFRIIRESRNHYLVRKSLN
jgi:ribosomal protein S18 acetylase RimI-like enzyme